MNIYKKLLVVGLMVLLIGTSFGAGIVSITDNNENVKKSLKINNKTKPSQTGRLWSDNFDSYETGSPLHGQGGWEAWDDNPDTTAYVTDAQSRSSPNSVDIAWFDGFSADVVQQFTDVNSGNWRLTAWQYVPSDMTGSSFFILMNTYAHGEPHNNPDWSLQLRVSASEGIIVDYNDASASLPLITDEWVLIRVEIDFEADIQEVYYGEEFLLSKSWSEGVAPGGAKNLACIDLYADQTLSSSVYYDDMTLEIPQPLSCDAHGPYEGIIDEDIEMDGTATGGMPPYEYLWDFGDGHTSEDMHPTHKYENPGIYTVTLTVTDFLEDTATDETTATIIGIPEIGIGAISGGKGISVSIRNNGNGDATDVSYNIEITGGLFINPKSESGDLGTLGPGDSEKITFSPFGIGFGIFTPMPNIIVTANCAEGSSDSRSQSARIILTSVITV
jgi:hypothetical protein